MAPHGDRKKGKGQDRPGKPELRPNRKEFKKYRKEEVEKGDGIEQQEQQPAPHSAALFNAADDGDFPRGGRSLLSRYEMAEARTEAEAEFEKEERMGNNKKRNANVSSGIDGDDDLGTLFGGATTGKLPRFANRITLKNILPNMKLWGVVIEVNQKDIIVSLPGGMRGFVRTEEVSDIALRGNSKDNEGSACAEVVHVGQLVPCMVVRVDDDKKEGKVNKRVWLSLRLSRMYKGLTLDAIQDGMVLTAQVKSVEDHGYILYFGVSTFSGFMPKADKETAKIECGQLIQCVVKAIDKPRCIIHLSSDEDLLSKSIIKDLKGLSIDHLIPGMMMNARVHSVLENGIMLSFFTYFTGTADIFNLSNSFPSGNWKDDYSKNKKVNARILFVDPSTRAVGLTLNQHLLRLKVPPTNVKVGEIYDKSRVLRMDKRAGLFLEIPSPIPSPGFVSIHDVSDKDVKNVEKKFREGSLTRVRVLGVRHLEGVALGTLKDSAFEGSVFTHADVKPGMVVRAKVVTVEPFGAIVQFSSGVKALCPLPHMSELDNVVKPPKKFKVGAELLFRVLGCKSKRITVTYKKSLVKSKLEVLASYADAKIGLVTHGWITKIEKHGCFVRFYNGVQGFVSRSEIGLEPGTEAENVYHVGQVVKCRIVNVIPASRKLIVSFTTSSNRAIQADTAKVGTVVSGVVERLTPAAVVVSVNGFSKGSILYEQLADYHGQAAQLKNLLKPGYEFNQLLVLDAEGQNLILSAKPSLINAANDIPSEISQMQAGAVVHGYICNIMEAGCFVRFLGHLTGFSPKDKAVDRPIEKLSDAFCVGQSVRSHVLNVNAESARVKLSLQQSMCSSPDCSFIQGYFLLDQKIAELKYSGSITSHDWMKSFAVGSLVKGEVGAVEEYGVILNFKDHSDVVGLIEHHQLGRGTLKVGSSVEGLVVDFSDGVVNLSLKPELVHSVSKDGKKKKRHRYEGLDLELNEEVNAVVEIVKDSYVVLSVPKYNNAIGFAPLMDYNSQLLPHHHYDNGQRISAVVVSIPCSDPSGRLILLPKTSAQDSGLSSSKRAKKKSDHKVGSLVEAEESILTKVEIDDLCRMSHLPRHRVSTTRTPGSVCIYEAIVKEGITFPLHPFFLEILNVFKIPPGRLMSHGWLAMSTFVEKCEEKNKKPLVENFLKLYNLRSCQKIFCTMRRKPGIEKTRDEREGRHLESDWQRRFFFWEPSSKDFPLEWGEAKPQKGVSHEKETSSIDSKRIKTLENKLEKQEKITEALDLRLKEAEQKVLDGEELRKELHNTILELKGNIRVFCRVRPLLSNESGAVSYPKSGENIGRGVKLMHNTQAYSFVFDKVFDDSASQEEVFTEISQLVQSALDGYKVCIFAYGQTGSGKTHTMMGNHEVHDQKGLIPRSLEQIFQTSQCLISQGWKYKMQASMLEIYNENIRDLLAANRSSVQDGAASKYNIKHDANGNTQVSELTVVDVQSINQVSSLLNRAAQSRSVAKTQMNEESSRSHCVFTLRIFAVNERTDQQVQGVLNLIDLAGSERLNDSGATGDRLKETQAINKSLSCLSDVIFSIANKDEHIPFRNSKLTYLLKPCLGGDSKTLMFVNLSPEASSTGASICSLRFAAKVNSCEIGIPRRQTQVPSLSLAIASPRGSYFSALKKESVMNAEGIRRCIEEKEAAAAARDRLALDAARLEKELTALNNEVQAVQRNREIIKTNLNKAEEEVKLLLEENRALDEANKRLVLLLEKEKQKRHRSERKHSASNFSKQKRKSSSLKDTNSPGLQPNSPDCRVHKKRKSSSLKGTNSPGLQSNSPDSRVHKK